MGSSTVTSSHIAIALSYSSANRQVTVFAVHVMRTWTRIITQPNAEVLDFRRCCFVDLLQWNNLTGGLLELLQLTQKVPETWFGHNVVRSEYSHFVERRVRLLFGHQFAADHLVFSQLKMESRNDFNIIAIARTVCDSNKTLGAKFEVRVSRFAQNNCVLAFNTLFILLCVLCHFNSPIALSGVSLIRRQCNYQSFFKLMNFICVPYWQISMWFTICTTEHFQSILSRKCFQSFYFHAWKR